MTLTFTDDLDMINVHHHTKFGDPNPNGPKDQNFFLVNFFLVNYYLVTFAIVTDRRTDRKRRIRAHRALAQVGSKTNCGRDYKNFDIFLGKMHITGLKSLHR